MLHSKKFNLFYYFVSLLFLFLSIYLLALPIWLDVFLWVLLILTLKKLFQILLTFTLILITIIFIISLPQVEDKNIYYRPHDKFADEKSYKKNINTTMTVEHGDMYSLDYASNTFIGSDYVTKKELIKEGKVIEFITDQYGYRNNLNSIEQSDIILIGDSFIAGVGNTQADIPSNQLTRLSGLSVSSIAFEGNPNLYEQIINDFIDIINEEAKIVIFYFEGNDFYKSKNVSLPTSTLLRKEYLNWEEKKDRILNRIYSKNNIFFRKIRRNVHKLNKKLIYTDDMGLVDVKRIGKNYVGFYKIYSSKQSITYILQNKKILEKVIGIFFIPTKARTYSNFINENYTKESFAYLKEEYNKLNIPVVDLSDTFEKNAAKELKKNNYLFWRDDSHWNALGIKIAMDCVKYFIIADISIRKNYKCE